MDGILRDLPLDRVSEEDHGPVPDVERFERLVDIEHVLETGDIRRDKLPKKLRGEKDLTV